MRILWWLGVFWVGLAWGDFYQASLLEAQWRLQMGPVSCRLNQSIPHLGQALFEQDAGEPLRFLLLLDHESQVVDASVQIRPAPWQHRALPGRAYPVAGIEEGPGALGQRLWVQGTAAERALNALFSGHFPAFIYRRSWNGGAIEAQVAISAVRFWEAYDGFQDCRRRLPPYGLRDFAGLRYHFRLHQDRLPGDLPVVLARMADYLKRLGRGQVIVQDETEPLAGRAGRLWFRKRFAAVRRQLLAQGLPASRVSTQAADGVQPRIELKLFGPEGLRLYHYGRRQHALTSAQKRRLSLLARYVQEFFPGRLIVHGYSDGARWRSERANRALARRWATKVRDFLLSQGVAQERMEVRAWGSRYRVASNLSKAGQAKNRRVVVELIAGPLQTAARN